MGQASLPMLAASIGAGAVSSYSDYKQAEAQSRLDEAVRTINNKEAVKSLMTNLNTLEGEAANLREDTISTELDIQRASAQAKGTALAQAGASGTGGTAVDMQIDEVESQSARALAKSTINFQRKTEQLKGAAVTAESQAKSRMQIMPGQKPDQLSFIMGGFGTAANTYTGLSSFLGD